MEDLVEQIALRVSLNEADIELIREHFVQEEIKGKMNLLETGRIERNIYFLSKGFVRGFQIVNGKLVVGHLVDEKQFFCAIESFTNETPSEDCFDTLTDTIVYKISKTNFDKLKAKSKKWSELFEIVMNDSFSCKLNRARDFQSLSAKDRYLKFVEENPNLALNVSVENIASYLGMEPQSLSRIRGQVTF